MQSVWESSCKTEREWVEVDDRRKTEKRRRDVRASKASKESERAEDKHEQTSQARRRLEARTCGL